MTNEEAIKTLKELSECSYVGSYSGEDKEALDMAISALKEEPVPFDFELFQAGLMDMPKGMTNGEVIQALFPNLDNANVSSYFSKVRNMEGHFIKTDKEFWNAPYQKGGE